MELQVSSSTNYELKKHVYTIHCSNNLSLLERKTFNALLYNAYYELPTKAQFSISTAKLSQLIGYNSNDTAKLKNALRGLVNTLLEWDLVGASKKEKAGFLKVSTALSGAEMSNGICTYEYSTIMRQCLYQPEMYAKINMDVISKFKSNYALALYENCIRYQGLSHTPWLPMDLFRKLMGVLETQYLVMKDFKQRVLDKALSEVNQYSEILVIPEFKKEGRKIAAIRFSINKKPKQLQNITNDGLTDELPLPKTMSQVFNLSLDRIKELRAEYSDEYIQEKIDIILQSKSYQAGKIESLSGYLINAIKQNHKKSISSKLLVEQQRLEKAIINKKEQSDREQKAAQEKSYSEYKADYIKNVIASLAIADTQSIHDKFIIDVIEPNTVYKNWFKKRGIENVAIKALFHSFIETAFPELFSSLEPFDIFIKEAGKDN